MKVEQWLKISELKLKNVGILTARLDCLVILEDVTEKNKAFVLANQNLRLSEQELRTLNNKVRQRSLHKPLAYIRGKTEFYGREFIINKYVLEPRPESETIIELLKNLELPFKTTILDLGTGSGALAVTAKLEIKNSKIIGTDIDHNCLKVARGNAIKHHVKVDLLFGDLMKPVSNRKIDVVLANLPYVPNNFKLNDAAMNEPQIAIFGGDDGLNVYRKFFKQVANLEIKPIFALTESLPFQHKKLINIARQNSYELEKTSDFIQVFRTN